MISHVLQTVELNPAIAPQVNVSRDAIDTFMVICVISLVVNIVWMAVLVGESVEMDVREVIMVGTVTLRARQIVHQVNVIQTLQLVNGHVSVASMVVCA